MLQEMRLEEVVRRALRGAPQTLAERLRPVFLTGLLGCLCVVTMAARAACTPLGGFSPPPALRQPVDLIAELERPWQAGGEIAVSCTPDGWPLAGRLQRPPRDHKEEMARRRANWELVRLVNLCRKPGVVKPRSLPVTPAQEAMLERFAMSDAGAVWMRMVADDSLRHFNRGDLELRRPVWERALRTRRMPKITDLLTGALSEAGLFSQQEPLFCIYAYAGEGAMAEPGLIGLGDAGFRCEFPASSELVDPLAILSHEFGHTRYGDPASAGSLEGEARTVANYENPVRLRNGFEPRTVYYLRAPEGGGAVQREGLLSRLIGWQTVEGITVEDRRAIEQTHCECPAPLPIAVDCVIRAGAPGAESHSSVFGQDCKVRWLSRPREAAASAAP